MGESFLAPSVVNLSFGSEHGGWKHFNGGLEIVKSNHCSISIEGSACQEASEADIAESGYRISWRLSSGSLFRVVFAEFSAQIKHHIGEENYANIVATLSTTGPIERAANEIVLMDTLKSYFTYEFHSLCGIPEVTLEGTADDSSLLKPN